MTGEEAQTLAKTLLSEKRYLHSVHVSEIAQELAKRNGASVQKAQLAGLLHDIAKEMPQDALLQLFHENAIIAGDVLERPPAVWHGVAAAILLQTQYGVKDAEILSAIACHTTGKVNMSTFDKIIYVADMISEERNFPGITHLRECALMDLEQATIEAMRMTLTFLKEKNKPVDETTQAAYAALTMQ